ncbi:hypothetical protein FDP22_15490 [Paroceanicella profunda]|uniref:Uncharacterized protein n=1 Tax=Paroceanicella profunda TaxID=2579971 RepID=A0A5B8G319_9RHOB|nr:DUF6476 family protein [Paroceanicella profunda]QDL93063.1 hypothetical protein FDP22_15490 [Paroceanicella profunda]
MREVDEDEEFPEHPRLRLLRWLVTGLTALLVVAVITIIGLLVIKVLEIPATPRPFALPASIAAPEGEELRSATLGSDWVLLVTARPDGTEYIRIYDAASGEERQSLLVTPTPPR